MSDLPVIKGDDFYALNEKMDFSKIEKNQFVVMVSTGDRDAGKALSTTIHGPYDFCEMIESVGMMWRDQLLHGKPFVLDKDPSKKVKWLDRNTVDYIEAHWEDMVADAFFGKLLSEDCTCQAGIEEASEEDLPKGKGLVD